MNRLDYFRNIFEKLSDIKEANTARYTLLGYADSSVMNEQPTDVNYFILRNELEDSADIDAIRNSAFELLRYLEKKSF
jgi:hypothetical protein